MFPFVSLELAVDISAWYMAVFLLLFKLFTMPIYIPLSMCLICILVWPWLYVLRSSIASKKTILRLIILLGDAPWLFLFTLKSYRCILRSNRPLD